MRGAWTRHDWLSPGRWRRRLVYWGGAVLVGLAAVGFAWLCDAAFDLFERLRAHHRGWPLLVTPLTFVALAWVTQGRLAATRGSGIPQVKAALSSTDGAWRAGLLSVRMALAKMGLTVLAMGGGASVGREGPTVHVGASLLFAVGRRFGSNDPIVSRHLVLAGAAAGIAAAFNTPLAGVVFAIEEMAGGFEERMSGVLLTAVIVAGVTAIGLLGDYAYFGHVDALLPLGEAWLAVLVTGLLCGLAGGLFARLILLQPVQWLRRLRFARARSGLLLAAGCGLLVAALTVLGGHDLHGTGYAQARAILQQEAGQDSGALYGLLKFAANVLSYWSGVPGGIFSPSLAVGAGLGQGLAPWIPSAPVATVVLLGMAGYLAGVTQAPLTAAVIALELTANHSMVIPIMATCLVARGASTLVCRKAVYGAFDDRLLADHRLTATPARAP